MKRKRQPGCRCTCAPVACATLTVHVTDDCNGAGTPGATVTVTDGTTTHTGTTDASGNYTTPALTSGTWTYTGSKFRRVTGSGSVVITCPQSPVSRTLALAIESGYHCDLIFGCADPLADTLYLTDSRTGDTTALVYTTPAGGGTSYFYGESTWTGWPGCTDAFGGGPARPVRMAYTIGLPPGPALSFGSKINAFGTPDNYPGDDLSAGFGSTLQGGYSVSSSCPPSFSYVLAGTWKSTLAAGHPYNTGACLNQGSATWTVVE